MRGPEVNMHLLEDKYMNEYIVCDIVVRLRRPENYNKKEL
jgi:hypothetical protein